MHKTTAIKLLGPGVSQAARRIGVSGSAIRQWPDVLPKRIEDRVLAALARQHLPQEVLDAAAAVPDETAPLCSPAGQQAAAAAVST